MRKRYALFVAICFIAAGIAFADEYRPTTDRPVVDMRVTLPNESMQTFTVPQGGLVTAVVSDAEYGFRPTILDSKPWSHVVVTVFKMGTKTEYTREIDEVDLKTGGPAVASKGSPSFKVAVTKVSPPTS